MTLLPPSVRDLTHRAGREVLKVYRNHPEESQKKADGSWLTEADLISHRILTEGLGHIVPIPVLSEETTPPEGRDEWTRFWMIDPLDGTRDFVHRTGDFSICVALVEDRVPVFGLIHAPFLAKTWWAESGKGAFVQTPSGTRALPLQPGLGRRGRAPTALTSRFHRSGGGTDRYLEDMGIHDHRRVGSAIKFGRLAEGGADVYVRLGPTMEWDVAAGFPLVKEVGLELLSLEDGKPLRFNKEDLHNPPFIVRPVSKEPPRPPPRKA